MHGPLICYECRIFLKEDEEHEKEQQAYEDRRQAKYKAQLEGDTVVKTHKEEATQEVKDPYDAQTQAIVNKAYFAHTRPTSKLHARNPGTGFSSWPTR